MDQNIVTIHETLDRNKLLDEAVFLAICGLQHCREGFAIIGIDRLEMARDKLSNIIDEINENFLKGDCLNGTSELY